MLFLVDKMSITAHKGEVESTTEGSEKLLIGIYVVGLYQTQL